MTWLKQQHYTRTALSTRPAKFYGPDRKAHFSYLRLKEVIHKFVNLKISEAQVSLDRPAILFCLFSFSTIHSCCPVIVTGWYLGTIFCKIGCSNCICIKNYLAQMLHRRKHWKRLTLVSWRILDIQLVFRDRQQSSSI